MDAIEELLNHIEDIKQNITDARYIDMLTSLQSLHREIRRDAEPSELQLNIEQLHLGDEYVYNLIRNIVGRQTMNAGHLSQILRRKGYTPQTMGYNSFKEWLQSLHILIIDNYICFP